MRLIILASVSVVALIGCKPVWDPTFMPSGYKHHSKNYKTPPGPEAKPIGYDFTVQDNQNVLDEWQSAVRDLVLRARTNGVNLNGPVFLHTDLQDGLLKSTMDNALRQTLREDGVILAAPGEAGTDIFYSAYGADLDDNAEYTNPRDYNDDVPHPHETGEFLPKQDDLKLTLGSLEGGVIANEAAATYDLPTFGYLPQGYVPPHEDPVTPNTPIYDESAEYND